MPDKLLQSMVQISDLHFGDMGVGGNAPTPVFLGIHPIFTGQLGHHRLAISDLHRFLSDRKDKGADDVVVVSGDVTANGSIQQFSLVKGFLGPFSPNSLFGMALGLTHWVDTGVPGNHDHWPGSNVIFGAPTSGLTDCFQKAFPHTVVRQLGDGIKIRFIMVNSDAQVMHYSPNRLMGRGSFVQQMIQLDIDLPDIEKNEVRVMVIHHAVTDLLQHPRQDRMPFPRRSPTSPRKPLEINAQSLSALEHAVVDHSIKIVMNGHLHIPQLTVLKASNDHETRDVFEARCGTTTQRDKYPYDYLMKFRPLPPLPRNVIAQVPGFMAHFAMREG